MPTLHIPILIVLLLIPNTTWRDWHAAQSTRTATPLQNQIAELMGEPGSSCAVAVMNDRTAEIDKITALAGARTLLAGARLKSSPVQSAAATGLGYTALVGNLPQSLARRGIAPEAGDPESLPLIAGSLVEPPTRGKFVVATLSANTEAGISQIKAWRDRIADAGDNGELILASPNPSPAEYQAHDQLTPILFWHSDDGVSSQELLYSPLNPHSRADRQHGRRRDNCRIGWCSADRPKLRQRLYAAGAAFQRRRNGYPDGNRQELSFAGATPKIGAVSSPPFWPY